MIRFYSDQPHDGNDLKGFEMVLQSIEAAAPHAIQLIINNLASHTHTGIDSGTISKPFKSFQNQPSNRQREVLIARALFGVCTRYFGGRGPIYGAVVNRIAPKQRIGRGEPMINAPLPKVFVSGLRRSEEILGNTPTQISPVGQR
jgi:hypothetical protein